MKKNYKIKISSGALVFCFFTLTVIVIFYSIFLPTLISYTIPKLPGIACGDFKYLQDGDSATIVGYTGAGGAIVIPENVNGLPVNRIGAGAFAKYGLRDYSPVNKAPNISSITLPQNLQYIDDVAFENSPITQIQIPSNVIYIGYWAFGGTNLGSIDIPGNVKTIEMNAFVNCNLKTVTLENGIETINYGIFSNSSYYNGQNRNTIQSLTIPASVTKIEAPIVTNSKFSNYIVDSKNQTYSSTSDGLLLNKAGDNIICCPSGKIGDVVIPSSVQNTDIDTLSHTGVFGECDKITSILFQSNNTFFNKDSLKNINDYDYSFGDHFDANNDTEDTNTVTDSQGVVYNKTKEILISCPKTLKGSYTIPDGVTTIGDQAFNHCENITSISIPNTVTTIGSSAFAGCAYLNKINIPTSVTTIGDGAFWSCIFLSDITIPSSVTNIGVKIFDFSVHNITVHGQAGSKIESYVNDYATSNIEIVYVNFTTSPEVVNYLGIAMRDSILFVYIIIAFIAVFLILLRVRTCKETINTDSEELE